MRMGAVATSSGKLFQLTMVLFSQFEKKKKKKEHRIRSLGATPSDEGVK